MIKNLLNNITIRVLQRIPYVQKLEADLKSALVGDLNIVSMNMKNGKLNIAFRTHVTKALAAFGNEILEEAEAKNYVEIAFGYDPNNLVGSILIQKHNGKSPNELKIIAEAERDQAIADRDKAYEDLAKAIAILEDRW